MTRAARIPYGAWPRGLSGALPAAYAGVSLNKFLAEIEEGLWPEPEARGGRATQFQDPTNRIPRIHRFKLLGILDAAVEQYSTEVEVLAHRAPLVRKVRLAILELLTVIRDAERDALIPPMERA